MSSLALIIKLFLKDSSLMRNSYLFLFSSQAKTNGINSNSRISFFILKFKKKCKTLVFFSNTALEGYILVPYNRKITDGGVIVNIGDKKFDFSGDEWL